MSRYYNKIIDLIKNEDVDKKSRDWRDIRGQYALVNYIKEHGKLTEDQFVELYTGDQAFSGSAAYLGNIASVHTDTQDPVGLIKKLKGKLEGLSSENNEDYFQSFRDSADKFLKTNSNEGISEGIEVGDKFIVESPMFTKSHLYKMIDRHPHLATAYTKHPEFDQKAAEMLLSNKDTPRNDIHNILNKVSEGYGSGNIPNEGEDRKVNLSPNVIHGVLDSHADVLDKNTLDMLLDHTEPSWKKNWVDTKLGIKDGEGNHVYKPEDFLDEGEHKEADWGNFQYKDKDKRLSDYLSQSRHLSDDQAENIKRHGNSEEKYNLYHNEHVDPKHGVEMFQKWYDDDHQDGYDAADLTEMYKDRKKDIYSMDDIDEDSKSQILEDGHDYIRESVENNYHFNDWADENEDKVKIFLTENNDEIWQGVNDSMYEKYDWTGENQNSVQNVGDKTFDGLNQVYDHIKEKGDDWINSEDIEKITGSKHDFFGFDGDHLDDDGDIALEDIEDKLNEYGGPLNVDYSNSDSHAIDEHPEYEDRYRESEGEVLDHHVSSANHYENGFFEEHMDDYFGSDRYQEEMMDAEREYLEENSSEHFDELYENSHQSHRFIPNHLHPHIPNYSELVEEEKKQKADGPNGAFLNANIKERDYEHHYGEDQHFHEMVRDHAEANNGKIDVGTMNKLYPNQKDKWKKVFGGKGKLTHEEASQKVDELPKTKYDISYGKWGSGMQNVNDQKQVIFRLDHSTDSLKPIMDDPDMYNTFKKVQGVSKQSGHPTNDSTIAWARVDTTDPNHWMIDEVQSDFGKTVTRYLKDQGSDDKAGHIDKINDHHKNWRENIVNSVLKEAKKHGAEKVSTHSPESKAKHTGSSKVHSVYKDSYKKVPRSMGFQSSHYEDLPLTDKGKGVFEGQLSQESLKDYESHVDAWDHHKTMESCHRDLGNTEHQDKHNNLANSHYERAKVIKPTHVDKHFKVPESGSEYSSVDISRAKRAGEENIVSTHSADSILESEPKPPRENHLKGHTFHLTPQLLKKNMDYTLDYLEKLEKGEFTRAAKGITLALGLGIAAQHVGKIDNKKPLMNNKRIAIMNANKQAKVQEINPEIEKVKNLEIEEKYQEPDESEANFTNRRMFRGHK